MKLQSGKRYEDRQGNIIAVTLTNRDAKYPFTGNNVCSYTPDGEYLKGDINMFDLIREVNESYHVVLLGGARCEPIEPSTPQVADLSDALKDVKDSLMTLQKVKPGKRFFAQIFRHDEHNNATLEGVYVWCLSNLYKLTDVEGLNSAPEALTQPGKGERLGS